MPNRAPHHRRARGRLRAVAAAFLTLLGGLTALLLPAAPANAASVSFTLGATRTDQNGNTLRLHLPILAAPQWPLTVIATDDHHSSSRVRPVQPTGQNPRTAIPLPPRRGSAPSRGGGSVAICRKLGLCRTRVRSHRPHLCVRRCGRRGSRQESPVPARAPPSTIRYSSRIGRPAGHLLISVSGSGSAAHMPRKSSITRCGHALRRSGPVGQPKTHRPRWGSASAPGRWRPTPSEEGRAFSWMRAA
jgi:hypothetical protein